jgi:hypothetical protein
MPAEDNKTTIFKWLSNQTSFWKWLASNFLSIFRHIMAIVILVFGYFVIKPSIEKVFSSSSHGEICSPDQLTATIVTSYRSEQMKFQGEGKSGSANEHDSNASKPNLEDERVVTETSQAPRVWVFFLSLAAIVGSLWGILWAAVSLCRID